MIYKTAIGSNPVVVTDLDSISVTASTVKVQKPHPQCIYLRTRAIGNLEVDGPNSNADAFPYGEFLNDKPGFGYKSFIGKKAFVEHNTDSVTNAIGDLVDSYLRQFDLGTLSSKTWHDLNDVERMSVIASFLKDDSGNELKKAYDISANPISEQLDGSIEVLMKIDRQRAPVIARQIDMNEKVGVSMGTAIAYSECSVCGNRAYYEKDYCNHVANGKGRHHPVMASDMHGLVKQGSIKPEWIRHMFNSASEVRSVLTNERRMVYAKSFEINYGLQFYELSVVASPAYHKGYMLEKVASQKTGVSDSEWLALMEDEELLELYANLKG
jgi:hypothetical protein